ncbi:unnamed protein product [Adineta steineri]|uniref:NAD(P)(+)--arginine ADP-ribosyltransferase n=1 Tax=Adineta steineri TaxID=433720 RepID=A0A819A2R8_9BILA|nr:unnamed protein product [Adineta steineri]CAF3777381.1 unnamed protein product [Adineta steineri]
MNFSDTFCIPIWKDHHKMAKDFADATDEPLEMLMPIQGYENMPLVSLEEAVQPIKNLIPDIQNMVWTAKERRENPSQNLTSDESASIALYTMEWEPHEHCFYYILNNMLRSQERTKLKPWFLYLRLFVAGLSKLPSIQRTVYRGVNGDILFSEAATTAYTSIETATADSLTTDTKANVAQENPRIHRFSDILEEKQCDMQPDTSVESIFDSGDVPLVSLETAVEPLRPFLPKVVYHATEAKQKCEGKHVVGLNEDQLASIMLYTMEWEEQNKSLYVVLNSILRSKDKEKLKPWLLYMRLIFTALSVLPSFKKTVYRGIKKDLSQEYPVDSTFVWWGFSSCTTNVRTLEADSFFGMDGTRTMFSIECETGKSVKSYSAYETENEILIPAGTQFTVVSVLPLPPDVHIIQLKEVRSTLFSYLSTAAVYRNTRLEEMIDQFENIDSDLNLSDFGEIKPGDMLIIVSRALKQKGCSTIYLGNNKITSEAVQTLADGLNEVTSLKGIYLSNNPIGDEGIKHLTRALTSERSTLSLTSLNIGNAQIGDEGARYLARMLQVNTSLTNLNLWKNSISDRGVIALAQALILNSQSKLAHLNLSHNSIGDGCIDVLIELIQQTHTLKELNLDGNKISKSGTTQLQNVVAKKDNFICRIQVASSKTHVCSLI